jgi:phosphatidylinositol-bisphosphatase
MQEANEVEAVDSDPYPDMLVLGFQELDLSTEALLYSTSTVREDAWCVAIFAALGEKAVLYEKVWIRSISILSSQSWLNIYLS